MNCIEPHTKINPSSYDEIISIGNKCPTAMILKELGVYKESYPFDYVPTTPKLILKYLQDPTEFYPFKNTVKTEDGLWFGHYDISEKYGQTIKTFKRRFE